MKVASSTFLFAGLPLADALKRVRSLGFTRAELSIHYKSAWGHLLPDMVHGEPEKALGTVKNAENESGVKIVAVAAHFDPLAQAERGQFEAVCALARGLEASLVSIVANQPSEWLAANTLKDHVSIARGNGLRLAVETFRPSVRPDPQSVMRLVEQVRDLKLTLDTGHLISNGHAQESWLPLFPHVGHVHVKDSGAGLDFVQMRVGEGVLDVGFLLSNLVKAGYRGELVVEYVGPREGREAAIDYEKESVRMKEVLESGLLDLGSVY